MALEDTDRELRRLREAADRIGTNLLDLELDSTRRLLDESTLGGESAAQWAEASGMLLDLWRLHGELIALLERAENVRGRRSRPGTDRLTEVDELLRAPWIEYRELGSPRCSPDELIGRMSADFDAARATLVRIGARWDMYVPRLHAARTEVGELAALFDALDEDEPPELGTARRLVAELGETLTKDPLALNGASVETLEDSLAAIRREAEALRELSGDIDSHLSDARGLLDELHRAGAESAASRRERALKIAGYSDAVPDPRVDALEGDLAAAAGLFESGALRDARRALADWKVRAETSLADLRADVVDARGSIGSRNELRSLLDAYQAKAKRLGVVEDSEVASIHAQAERSLYTAPTDLERARQLIARYREAIAERAALREVR
jgi:hypothetical protein